MELSRPVGQRVEARRELHYEVGFLGHAMCGSFDWLRLVAVDQVVWEMLSELVESNQIVAKAGMLQEAAGGWQAKVQRTNRGTIWI